MLTRVTCAVAPEWAARYRDTLAGGGLAAVFIGDGDALTERLARDWEPGVVILDLGLATPSLAARLGPAGPRLLAFGSAENAGIALAANLAGFLPQHPDNGELLAAIEAAMASERAGEVADLSDRTTARLGALGAEADRVANALARLTTPAADTALPIDLNVVRGLIRARRARSRYFSADILGDPAWDMLLDLTAARIEARTVSVSSLCIAAGVPTTTALRWVRNLCDAGLFERTNDPHDARRAFIALAEPAARSMAAYLAAYAMPGS